MSLFSKKLARQAVPTSSRFQDIDLLEQRLWQRAELEERVSCEIRKFVCLIGFCGSDLAKTGKLLRDLGVQKIAIFSDITKLYEAIDQPSKRIGKREAFSHVFINLDSFRSLECGVDVLLSFRSFYKSARIILTSAHAVADDFGDEKKSICDATLSFPLSVKNLKVAIRSS